MAGPVFLWELVRSSRRRWHWWARGLFVLLLFLLLNGEFQVGGSISSLRGMAAAGAAFYRSLTICQLMAVIILSPVYAAASVVEEKTQQTLPFLLASSLSDREIISGKLWLASWRVWEVLLCALPLAAMCLWLGGVPPEVVFADFLVAMSAAWATCAMAILAAVWGRRLVEVLLLLYVVQAFWYFLPWIQLMLGFAGIGMQIPDVILRMNAFKAISNGQAPGSVLWWDFYGVPVVAMAGWGAACWLLAWISLRPAWHRAQSQSEPARTGVFGRMSRRRGKTDNPVWNNPVLWRELRCRRPTRIDRIVWVVGFLLAVVALAWIVADWQEMKDLARAGPIPAGPPVAMIVAFISVFFHLAVIALPYLATAGATAFAEERDSNQLDLLLTTDLDHREIVRAKAVRLAGLVVVIMLFPVLVTAMFHAVQFHSFGEFLLMAAQCLASGALAASLGLALSVFRPKPTQAVVTNLAILIVLWFAIPLCAMFVALNREPILLSPPLHWLMFVESFPRRYTPNDSWNHMYTTSVFVSAAYAMASLALYWCALPALGLWRRLERLVWGLHLAGVLLVMGLASVSALLGDHNYTLQIMDADTLAVVQFVLLCVPFIGLSAATAFTEHRNRPEFARWTGTSQDWQQVWRLSLKSLAIKCCGMLALPVTLGVFHVVFLKAGMAQFFAPIALSVVTLAITSMLGLHFGFERAATRQARQSWRSSLP